jgi:site-specific recombinase XerD
MTGTLRKPFLPASEQSVAAYVVHLRREVDFRVQTIRNHLSSITFYHKISSFPSPVTDSFLLEKLLLSYEKEDPSQDFRLPITKSVLSSIHEAVAKVTYSTRERSMLSALFSLMYHGLLRVSEIAKTDGPTDHNLQFCQITQKSQIQPELYIQFQSYKHSDKQSLPPPIRISSNQSKQCPVSLYNNYLKHRGQFHHPTKAFCHPNSTPLTRDYVAKKLRSALSMALLDSSEFNTHSFRIGRATDMAAAGASDRQIMIAGRWKSLAFKKYIRPAIIPL